MGGRWAQLPPRLPRVRDFSKIWTRSQSLVLLSIAEIGSANILAVVAERLEQRTLGFCRSDVRD